jgi:hypothetical protein
VTSAPVLKTQLFQKFTDFRRIRVEMMPLLESSDECDEIGDPCNARFVAN